MTTAIVWFRRDLRLADNPAFHTAQTAYQRVLPVYIHAPNEAAPWAAGAASSWWLHHSLVALRNALETLGLPLVIRRGDSLSQLRELVRHSQATALFWNRDYEPALIARDRRIKELIRDDGIHVKSFNARLLSEPWGLKTGAGGPYQVFSPYWRSASNLLRVSLQNGREPLPAPPRKRGLPTKVPGGVSIDALGLLPQIPWDGGLREAWIPGEQGALARLEVFVTGALKAYRSHRDFPAEPATSSLSPHLAFGEISPLQIVARIERLHGQAHTDGLLGGGEWFIRELGWREFCYHLLFHFPHTTDQPLIDRFERFPWRPKAEYAADLKAWQRGATGVPIVDAGMRELWHTGWMHNRVRMIVASFLTKNLLIPWQEGARWFWDTLVDADLANNTGGWQWTAGSGADAAPYFRVFNPVLQSRKFDAKGEYVRRWVPELRALPEAWLQAPWECKPDVLAQANFRLGIDYPAPIVDLSTSRNQALQAYQQTKR